jgi:hypothetical protein
MWIFQLLNIDLTIKKILFIKDKIEKNDQNYKNGKIMKKKLKSEPIFFAIKKIMELNKKK